MRLRIVLFILSCINISLIAGDGHQPLIQRHWKRDEVLNFVSLARERKGRHSSYDHPTSPPTPKKQRAGGKHSRVLAMLSRRYLGAINKFYDTRPGSQCGQKDNPTTPPTPKCKLLPHDSDNESNGVSSDGFISDDEEKTIDPFGLERAPSFQQLGSPVKRFPSVASSMAELDQWYDTPCSPIKANLTGTTPPTPRIKRAHGTTPPSPKVPKK